MNQYPTTLQAHSGLSTLKRMSGLSLIELMIGLVISSILMIGVSNIYFNSRESDTFTNELSRIQETGRQAIDFLARDIRMAGYQGCMDPATVAVNIIANNPPTENFFKSALIGFEVEDNNWATDNDIDPLTGDIIRNNGEYFRNEDFVDNALVGSDVISIQGATVANAQLVGNMTAANANIQISNNDMGFVQDDIVVIASCQNADMFRITNNPNAGANVTLAHAMGSNSDNRLSQPYTDSAQIMRFESVVYFVAATGRTTDRGIPINALYRATDTMSNTANPNFTVEELISGVDNMQVLYGERLVNGNLRYVTADEVDDMQLVESVQLGLLISGKREVLLTNDEASYLLPGETIQSSTSDAEVIYDSDRRLRREFSTTINLRNRRTTI
ncbi:hypothetical protein A3752_06025 [Oleiphilus sp. HI0081]|jgi:type IV pilus assembly protein PilW|uniref:PilW family protein n=1 Tax=Oleiphilus sp. HI0132 TaxID=1822270 RepID=UPI0007C27D1A|nr:PilW family protein [Oleiphilus sp. HI0132]KZY89004.1 hypothetical protein A3743_09670 [Oleiphilus sp. HI0072]KZZ22646.1 hypothetical protein A3752_06025 [Oleiphilus sp. HI0081]KZZ75860.1 hypothetical protein A3766_02940 [Oleiphilus sp. HI0132]